jgi:hypothetical protein
MLEALGFAPKHRKLRELDDVDKQKLLERGGSTREGDLDRVAGLGASTYVWHGLGCVLGRGCMHVWQRPVRHGLGCVMGRWCVQAWGLPVRHGLVCVLGL